MVRVSRLKKRLARARKAKRVKKRLRKGFGVHMHTKISTCDAQVVLETMAVMGDEFADESQGRPLCTMFDLCHCLTHNTLSRHCEH